jgi:FMN phosphatase YigB (HAD superfamily)
MAPGLLSPPIYIGTRYKEQNSIPSPSSHDLQSTCMVANPALEHGTTLPSIADKRPSTSKSRTLILDLGDVLFHYSAHNLTAISPATFGAALKLPAWGEFERGQLTEDECVAAIGDELSLDHDAIRKALSQCRSMLRVDLEFYKELRSLKAEMDGHLKVYAMTNVDKDDFTLLKAILPSWDLFDAEFTSFEVGMIKPELAFYKHVLETTNTSDPTSAIFVDDKLVNVNAARYFGIDGIVFESPKATIRQLRNRLFEPVTRARAYMKNNARNHVSTIENGIEFRDVFSQFLIHEKLQDPSIINLSPRSASVAEIEQKIAEAGKHAQIWNYFIEEPVGTTKTFPEDVDDTSIALLAFSPPERSASSVLDLFLTNRNARDDLIETYLCKNRPGICPIVLTNVVRVFYHYGRGADVQNELDFIRRILLNRGYIDGTAFYPSPETFLYFMSSLIEANPEASEIQSLRELVINALRERVGHRGDSFAIAARVLACQILGVWTGSDVSYLKELQDTDGGWKIGWICQYGRSRKRIGNRGVVTAYAIRALEEHAKVDTII